MFISFALFYIFKQQIIFTGLQKTIEKMSTL